MQKWLSRYRTALLAPTLVHRKSLRACCRRATHRAHPPKGQFVEVAMLRLPFALLFDEPLELLRSAGDCR